MTKQFSLLQLFSLVDGRLSTNMDDVYDMLNHICNENLMTHHLPVAMGYLKEKNPEWFYNQQVRLESIARTHFYSPIAEITIFSFKDVPFTDFIKVIKEKYDEQIDVPQLEDEFDTSDFGNYMVENSLLKNIGSKK